VIVIVLKDDDTRISVEYMSQIYNCTEVSLFQTPSPNYEKRLFASSGLSVRLSFRLEHLCSQWTDVHEI